MNTAERVQARVARVLVEHQAPVAFGGVATGSTCPCTCGEQNPIDGGRDMALSKARHHVAERVRAALSAELADIWDEGFRAAGIQLPTVPPKSPSNPYRKADR